MVMTLFNEVMIQTFSYGVVMIGTILFCMAFLRGFLVKYFQVRISFGKYVLVKIRSPLRDYFEKGWVEEGFLIYKHDKNTIRLNIPQDQNPFYKCLAVNWVDVDDEKHAICKPDYSVVSGYDAVKNNDLHTRALMKPSIQDNQQKIIIGLIILVCLISLGALYLAYCNYAMLQEVRTLPQIVANLKGTVVGGGGF